jgi:hypothetical protein
MPCRWCSAGLDVDAYTGRARGALPGRAREFCGPTCASRWHALRRARGEQAYDVLIAWATARHGKGSGAILTDLTRMVKVWLEEDLKAGRRKPKAPRSWSSARRAGSASRRTPSCTARRSSARRGAGARRHIANRERGLGARGHAASVT